MQSAKSSKRLDLQGIRGLAIIVVLGFHFYPKIFPNGYLGVDQFFVLSGFLMCMLLKRGGNHMQSCSLIILFYSKRFKRILPLYLLIILLSLVSLYTIFPETVVETNTKSAKQALLFISNRPKSVEENYFESLAIGMDMFTHTWSLSVEIQFYFIVPFIFIIGSLFPIYGQYLYYSLIGTSSFLFYSISDANTAFNSVFARIWQFTIGMIVYMISQTDYSNNGYKLVPNRTDECCKKLMEDEMDIEIETPPLPTKRSFIFGLTFKYFSLLSLVCITIYPIALPVVIVRPYVTILTGILMLISMDDYLLSNQILTYIGDISYSLYLLHWPIYAYWKLMYVDDYLVMFLSLSVVISITIHHGYEKWYLKLKSINIAILVIILLITNVILINNQQLFERKPDVIYNANTNATQSQNETVSKLSNPFDQIVSKTDKILDTAEKLNNLWNADDVKSCSSSHCVYGARLWGDCHMKDLNPNSTIRLAVIGNSWAANIANLFWEECGQVAGNILVDAEPSCEPLVITKNLSPCPARIETYYERAKKLKPDYLFILSKSMSTGEPFNGSSIETDPTYLTMKSWLLKYLDIVNKDIYILNAMAQVEATFVAKIAPQLKSGMSIENVDKSTMKDELGSENARKRYDKLIKDCGGRCHLIDYKQDFYDEKLKRWRFFDKSNGYSWFTHSEHLTPHAWERVRYHYTDICKRIHNK